MSFVPNMDSKSLKGHAEELKRTKTREIEDLVEIYLHKLCVILGWRVLQGAWIFYGLMQGVFMD